MWKRRWAKAKAIMDREGVMLRTWRVGTDVSDVCIEAVKQELRGMEQAERRDMELQRSKNKKDAGNKRSQDPLIKI